MKSVKIIAAVTSAVMLLSSATLGVSAENYTDGVSVLSEAYASASTYKNALSMAELKYDKALASKVEKYMKKSDGKTVAYSKSLTKKFADKYSKRTDAIKNGDKDAVKSGYVLAMATDEMVYISVYKNYNFTEVQAFSSDIDAVYINKSSIVHADLDDKTKKTDKIKRPEEYDSYINSYILSIDVPLKDKDKVTVFKFTHNKENYTLEIIYDGKTNTGLLYDSKGSIAGGCDEGSSFMAMRFSLSADDSLFKMPSGLKEKEYLPCGN